MKKIMTLLIVVILAFALPITALASSKVNNGITLTYPNDLTECKNNFLFHTYGVDPDWPLTYAVFKLVGNNLVRISGGSTTGNLYAGISAYPISPNTSDTFAIFVSVNVPNQAGSTKLTGQWHVSCYKTAAP